MVFVRGVHRNCYADDVRNCLGQYVPNEHILSINLVEDKMVSMVGQAVNKGYGFIKFHKAVNIGKLMTENIQLRGRKLTFSKYIPKFKPGASQQEACKMEVEKPDLSN